MMYVLYLFCLSYTAAALDLYAVSHLSYLGKVLPGSVASKQLLFGGSEGQRYLQRFWLDDLCRWRCFRLENSQCKAFQTYWTTDGSFYCELLNTTLCSACTAALVDQAPNQLDARVWEVKFADQDRRPTVPCVELPDWKVKGNCSECGKIGYYGRNCALRSSCASYYYDPGAVQDSINATRASLRTIAPCFTGGVNMATSCRGQFTRWLFTSLQQDKNKWWNENQTLLWSQFRSQLPYHMALASQILGPRGRNLFFRLDTNSPPVSYVLYSNFSLGANGSLTLGRKLSPELADGLNVPVANAPLLKAMNESCGPMWLVNQSAPNNQTHIDSCSLSTSVFSLRAKWAGQTFANMALFIDVDYFQCPDD